MAETVLQKIVNRKHYKFLEEQVTWQEAVKLSTDSLVADGTVEPDYYKQIVDCIEKYGPYMVFDHYVAMPHSTENAVGANRTGIGFMVCKNVIEFGTDEDGEKKEAKLLFTLAAASPEEHMDNIMQLMNIFQNEELLDALMAANTPEDILKAEQDFPCEEDE